MPLPDTSSFYARRAAQARQFAATASSVEARLVHEEMAVVYERLAGTEPARTERPRLKLA